MQHLKGCSTPSINQQESEHDMIQNLLKLAFPLLMALAASAPAYAAKPSDKLLTPKNHTLILIDHQPQMAFATRSIDIAELRNNTTGLAKAAKVFKVPTILTTVA